MLGTVHSLKMQLFALYIYENEQPMSVRKSNVTLPWDIYQWRHYPDALPAYKTKANSTQTQMFSLGSLEGLQLSGVWMTQMTCKMTASLRSTTNVPARVLKGLFWHFERTLEKFVHLINIKNSTKVTISLSY